MFVAGAENDILGYREVNLAAALTLGVVFGNEMLHLVATLEVVVEVISSIIHHGIHALDGTFQTVILQVVSALGSGCDTQCQKQYCRKYLVSLHFLFFKNYIP